MYANLECPNAAVAAAAAVVVEAVATGGDA